MNTKGEREDELVLELLDAIGKQSNLSQRHLARQLGVALGLANSYLKRCIRKGYVKIRTAPANRYLYYLTPKGFAEKSRLTAKYLSYSFTFYRRASASCAEVFQQCALRGWKRVVLCGISDLAEIASLQATEAEIEIVAIYDPRADRERFVGKKVWTDLDGIETFDACVLTDLQSPSTSHQQLVERVGQERVMVPDILRLE
ncbi:MAG: winged helix-turn-helix transcriptional regulator [Proteobacteria bacterium]|nr:winged helix-turn-helix transcriptional regulator [Pseudomonadota bacterium]